MNFEFDYYAILGVSKKASQKEIETAWKNFQTTSYNTISPWQRLQKSDAYKVLSDEKLRLEYDNFREKRVNKITRDKKKTIKIYEKIKCYFLKNTLVCTFSFILFVVISVTIYQQLTIMKLGKQISNLEYEISDLEHQIQSLDAKMMWKRF